MPNKKSSSLVRAGHALHYRDSIPGGLARSSCSSRGGPVKVVLASESQARKRALDILGLKYEVHPSAIDEKAVRDADPAALTRKKMRALSVPRSFAGLWPAPGSRPAAINRSAADRLCPRRISTEFQAAAS